MTVFEILKALREEGKIKKDDERIVAFLPFLMKRKFIVLKCGLYWMADVQGLPESIHEFEFYYLTAKGEAYLFKKVSC